jgi:hypothetical protein
VPEGFETLQAGEREIHFLGVYPLHADEMQRKLDEGVEGLLDPFDQAEITELLDPSRPSALA